MRMLKSERGIIYVDPKNGTTQVKQLDEMSIDEFRMRWQGHYIKAFLIACRLNESGRWGTVHVVDNISEEDAGFILTDSGFARLMRDVYTRNAIAKE